MNKLLVNMLKAPKLILVLILIFTIIFFIVMKNKSRMETDLDKYMPQEHPAFVYSNQAEEWFNIKDAIIIAIENPNGIYNTGTLKKIKSLTKQLQKMPEINKNDVTSLYTADNIIGSEYGLEVKPFYKKVPKQTEVLEALQSSVRNNEMIFKRLVSANENVTIIVAEIEDDVFTQEFYRRVIKLADTYETPERLYVAGRPIVEGTLAYLAPRDMKRMVPIVILIIIIALLIVLKSVKSTIFTLLVVLLSTIWTFGLMGILNIPIYAVSTMIPVMLIAIGVADGIHLYSHLHLFLINNPSVSKYDAIRDMIKNMWKPVVMTSITTAVGFVSLLTSQVYPIKYFGLFTAFGVLCAMIFSLVLIPAGIMVFGLPKWKKETIKNSSSNKYSYKFAEILVNHKYLTFFVTIFIIIFSITGISRVWINSSFLEKFEKDSNIVQTDKFINQYFGGTTKFNVILDADKKDTFKNPDILKIIDNIQNKTEDDIKIVGNSFALTDYLKRMNKVMHSNKEKFNTIPESRELVAQYLLLYEMSGDPDNLWKVVNYDYKRANLTFQIKSDSSKAINKLIAAIEKYIPTLEKNNIKMNYAGSGYKALVFTDLILKGQIASLILSLFIVIILLSIMFKNFIIGIIGAIPIIITALITFGLMGLLNIPLNTTTAMLSSIAIGIGIDYAIHFIEKYKIFALKNNDKLLIGQKTMHHAGRAIIYNAIVVIAGFIVLLFSVFPANRVLGALISLNMFTSFLGTVTVMYLLLYISNIYYKKETTNGK